MKNEQYKNEHKTQNRGKTTAVLHFTGTLTCVRALCCRLCVRVFSARYFIFVVVCCLLFVLVKFCHKFQRKHGTYQANRKKVYGWQR